MKKLLSFLTFLFLPLLGFGQVAINVTDTVFNTSAGRVAGRTTAGPGATSELTSDQSLGVVGQGTGAFGFRNRITNGDCRIDQRHVGASTTAATFSSIYTADKWRYFTLTSAAGTVIQQVTDAPTGFGYSTKITIGTGASPASTDVNQLQQTVEGPEIYDFNFGTANAVTSTLSYWVKGSVTGTYGLALVNSAGNRNYIAQYTINGANTWEKKTNTITVDTTGTWLTGIGTVGCFVTFDLGSGSTFEGTANTWQTGSLRRVSTNIKLIATSSATLAVTGVQWERGSLATDFEQSSYAIELIRCQRYYQKSFSQSTAPAQNTGTNTSENVLASVATGALTNYLYITYPVTMAVAPTFTTYNPNNTNNQMRDLTQAADCSSTGTSNISDRGALIFSTGPIGQIINDRMNMHWSADTGL